MFSGCSTPLNRTNATQAHVVRYFFTASLAEHSVLCYSFFLPFLLMYSGLFQIKHTRAALALQASGTQPADPIQPANSAVLAYSPEPSEESRMSRVGGAQRWSCANVDKLD